MTAVSDTANFDWTAEAVALRRDEKMATAEIAERVGRSASQVRRVLAAANTERAINGRGPESNGDGAHEIPGQTTVDDHLPPTEIVWTGENWPEFRAFLGRPEGSPLISHNFDLPASVAGDMVVRVEPGDTVIKKADGTFEVTVNVDPEDDPESFDADGQFRANAGEAVGKMPKREMDGGDVVVETRLAGTRQMALDFGENSNLAGAATIVFKSEKLASGFYGLGDLVAGTFVARVTSAPGREKFDKDAEEWRTEDVAYGATMTEVALAPAPHSRDGLDLAEAIDTLERYGYGSAAALLRRLVVGGAG